MGLKTLLWGGFFAVACVGALWSPIFGIIGYMGHYIIGPESQWWNAPLRPLGLRYSFTLAVFAAAGTLLNWNSLRFGRSILHPQEKLILLFLGIMWILTILGPETRVGNYTGVDYPAMKLTKIAIFILILTHVATNLKNLNWFMWMFVIGAMILGMRAYSTPYSSFEDGRLEGLGGPDFHDANTFGGFMAAMLFLIGVQFICSGVVGRLICLVSGVFTANAIVLTRSRGAMVGVFAGVLMALFLAPREYRRKVIAALLVAGIGMLYLMDPQSFKRTGTITRSAEERDSSAQSRIIIWTAAIKMTADHPLGVGPGNFFQSIGKYCPEYRNGISAHSTYFQCAGELGLPGLMVFCALVINAMMILRRLQQTARTLPPKEQNQILWVSYGLATAITAILAYGTTSSVIYMEAVWWLLAMPVCVSRTVDNLVDDCSLSDADEDSWFDEEDPVNEEDSVVEAALQSEVGA